MLHPSYLPAVADHLRAIDACLDEGRTADAARLAREAIAAGLKDARLHRLVAWELEQQGRYSEALPELERGLELAPADLDLIIGVGFCLLRSDRYLEALNVFRHAAGLAPEADLAHFGCGVALKATAALAEAAEAFQKTLVLNPAHARALAELAGIYESQGLREEARSLADRALELDPADLEAPLVLAKLALQEGDHAAAESRAREVLEKPGFGLGKQAEIRFLHADALDGLGRAGDAFEAYVAAKSLVRDRFVNSYGAPGRETAFQGASRVLDEFLATPGERWSSPAEGASAGARNPIFLFGFARSGTTLLENVLASHPQVVCLEEKSTLDDAAPLFLGAAGGVERLSRIASSDLGAFRAAYWRRVRKFGVDPRDRVFVDKQPFGVFMLPIVAKLFPGAKILFPLRDPRDVVLSCFRRDFQMTSAIFEFTSLERTARLYDLAMRSKEAFLDRLPLAVHEVRYERIVEDFDGEVKAVCAFLGVDWAERMRDFHKTARARGVHSRSSNQVTQALNSKGVAQWRRYERALEPVLPILEPWVARFGYAA